MISTLILRTAARLLVPLGLMFAFFIYLKGHQTPGGGFVGGLVAAVTLLVHRLAFGRESLRALLPVSYRTLIALGLALALGTGAAPLLWGLPFFTSNWGYLPIPGAGPFHWATVMVFDLGVMLVVTGVVAGMVNALSQEVEREGVEP